MPDTQMQEWQAAAAKADGELTHLGIPALPSGRDEYVLPVKGFDADGASVAHTVDATKSEYDMAPGPISTNRNPNMRSGNHQPVTADEAKQKAAVLADTNNIPE